MKFNLSTEEQRLFDTCYSAATAAHDILLDGSLKIKNVEEKEAAGLVTQFDRMSELAVRDIIRQAFPSHRIIGEEFGDDGATQPIDSAYSWYIDPLDGTTNFVYGFPVFGVSLAIYKDHRPLIAMVFAPLLQKKYVAVYGQGAFCNDQRIHVSSQTQLKDTLMATGFASQSKRGLNNQIEILREVLQVNRGIRRAGAAALDLCWVAEGVFDGFWEFELSPWDTAAGSLIVTEAGGQISTSDGAPFHPEQSSVVATNGKIHAQLVEVMSRANQR